MPWAANVQVVFGPTNDSYLIVHGGRCAGQNMPQDLVDMLTIRSEVAPLMRVAWIRLHSDGKRWVIKDGAYEQVFDRRFWMHPLNALERQKIQYWAGDADGIGYFVSSGDTWRIFLDRRNTAISKSHINEVARLRQKLPNFDTSLRRIIYGKAARIYVFNDCFHADLRGKLYVDTHPLVQVLVKYARPGWILDDSSSLSLYNEDYFCLKFKRVNEKRIVPVEHVYIRAHATVMTQLKAMTALAETEEEMTSMDREVTLYMDMVKSRHQVQVITSFVEQVGDQVYTDDWADFERSMSDLMSTDYAASHVQNAGFYYGVNYPGSGYY